MERIGFLNRLAAATIITGLYLTTSAHAEDPIKIGVVLPLSGANAQFGQNSRWGVELALEQLRASEGEGGLSRQVELVFADVPTPGDAGAAVQRLIAQDHVVGLIGSFASSITLAASEVAERAEVPMITHSFADQITERGFSYIFQVSPKASTFGDAQLNYALEIAKGAGVEVKDIAIVFEDTAYGSAQAAGVRDAAHKAGIEILVDEAYPLGIADASRLVNLMRRSEADIIFPVSYLNDSLLIIRTMRQQGVTAPAVGGAAGYIIPDFKKGLGEFAEGVFSVSPANYDAVSDINEIYHERHGVFIAHEAIMYGAALQHMIKAIEAAGSAEPAEVRDAIATLKYCDGFAVGIPGGCTSFDEKGLTNTAKPIFVQWRGDELLTVYPAENATADPEWQSN